MDTLYAARMHGFPNLTRGSALLPGETPFSEENILSLLIVLGSSVSLVGLVFAFITYRYVYEINSQFILFIAVNFEFSNAKVQTKVRIYNREKPNLLNIYIPELRCHKSYSWQLGN